MINLWASWCDPCRDELPVMQRLADRAAGRLHVLGVDTGDGRDAGRLVRRRQGRHHARPCTTADRKLLDALGRINLPVTSSSTRPAGRYVTPALPLDAPTLADLVREHTGVTVTP